MTSEFAIAVHALVFLDRSNATIASEELADNVCTNPVCIRRVMGKLKKAGLIETREGMGGGYRIAKVNSDITLRQISDALENTLVKASWRSGNPDKKCLVASGMSVVMDELVTGMNRSCNDYLERITIQKVEERLTALKEEKDNETGQTMGPVVDELAQELTDVKVGKVNVDEQMALAREYKVMSIPTFLVFKDGKVAERTLGVQEKSELEQLIR